MDTHLADMQYCFLIATQSNSSLPYVILVLDEDADYIRAISRNKLLSLCSSNKIHLCNAVLSEVQSGIFTAPLEEYSELQLNEHAMRLDHPYILWDILAELIKENATFKLPGVTDKVFSFADISFSMKTDEVSVSFYHEGQKVTCVLWSTPKIDAPSDCGSIMIRCSDTLKSRILGQSVSAHAVASTTSYFSPNSDEDYFMVNLSHMTCMWDTRYCLKRFHIAELSGLLNLYEKYKAKAIGYDLAVAFNSQSSLTPDGLFSHINGKSSTSSSSVSFVIALSFPDILKLAVLLRSDRRAIEKFCNSEDGLSMLKSYILSKLPGTISNRYLTVLCQTFLDVLRGNQVNIKYIQTITTGLACRIFQYKMAYANPVISIPSSVTFDDGRLLIYKGGAVC